MNALLASARSTIRFSHALSFPRSVSTSFFVQADGLKGFKEGEKAMEDIYFTKEDQRVLSKILNKVKDQSDKSDVHAAAGVKAAELSALKKIIEQYKISSTDVESLMKWKHTQY